VRAMSNKRRRQQPIRKKVVAETIELAGGLCQAQGFRGSYCYPGDVYDCHGEPCGDVHEVIKRSRRPGAHLDVTLTVFTCRVHHDEIEMHEPEARLAGLAFRSWELEAARASVLALREGRQP
jgi:hypothetical protein